VGGAEGSDFRGTERFEVRRRLGAGGFGVVYEAHDRERGERVALKTLTRVNPATLYRFKKEFRALADVAHRNLVVLHELFSEAETWFFTMELVEGTSFVDFVCPASGPGCPLDPGVAAAETIEATPAEAAAAPAIGPSLPAATAEADRAVDEGRLRSALRQLAEGVAALHAAGKLHRDIKPSNVLVARDGRVVLLDFGLVTEVDASDAPSPAGASASLEDHFVGTPSYMAPEQVTRKPLAGATDWYAVGVVLFRALTGRLPFEGAAVDVLVEKQVQDAPAPSSLARGVPPDLDALCVALLRRHPRDRPADADVLRALGVEEGARRAAAAATASSSGTLPAVSIPLVGRGRELASLREAFEAARRGRAVAVLVLGVSGAGKSALVRDVVDGLKQRDEATILAGRCYERESVPFKALDPLVDALARRLARLPRVEAEGLVPRDAHALVRLFPVLGRVEAVARAPRRLGGEAPDPQELRRRAFGGLRELLARLADRRPVVLLIDDLQWGDQDSALVLADLLRPPDPPALLLVACCRAEDAAASPIVRALRTRRSGPEDALDLREVEVGPLAPDDATALAVALLGPDGEGPAGRTLAASIAAESGGNPFFVGELVRYVQVDVSASRRFRKGQVTMDGLVRARAAHLPAEARRLLEAVAVAARPLPSDVAARAAEIPPEAARTALAVLRAAHLVRTRAGGGGGLGGSSSGAVRAGAADEHVEAYHDRIREALAAALAPEALAGWHRRLSAELEATGRADPETLATHLEGAGERERAGALAAEAARRAAGTLAFDRAARLYRFALERLPRAADAGREATLLTGLADALASAGRGAEAAPAYREAAARVDPTEALELRRRAAEQCLRSGRIDEGTAEVRGVLAAVGLRIAATPRRALVSRFLKGIRLRLRGIGFRERAPAELAPGDLACIDVCWSVAMGLSLVDPIRGADFSTRHLLLALRAGEPYRVARALALEAGHGASAGARARERTERLLAAAGTIARRLDHPHALALVQLMGGIAAFLEGRWRSAQGLLDEADATLRDRCAGVAWELANVYWFSGVCRFFLGEVGEICRRARALLEDAESRGDRFGAACVVIGFTNTAWLAAGEPGEARREVEDVLGRWSRAGFHVQHQFDLYLGAQGDLYEGRGRSAWESVVERWRAVERSLLLRIQYCRVLLHHLRARAAVAAASEAGGADRAALLASAERDARRLERERAPWVDPVALLVRAGVAAVRGRAEECVARLGAAARGFEAADMRLHAAVARRARGSVEGGERGRALVAEADAWLVRERVKSPARFAAVLAPGFEAAAT